MSHQYKNRNGNIDFIRFMLAFVLVLFHGRKLTGSGLFPRGATAVEAFFVIAGYYMARTGMRRKTPPVSYMFKRYTEIFPHHVFAFLCAFVWRGFRTGCFSGGAGHNLRETAMLALRSVPEFLILPPLAGLQYNLAGINGIEWYLSGMLLGMILLYPLLLRYSEMFALYAAPVIYLFLSGFLYQKHGSFRVTYAMYGLVNGGLIRALAMLSLGVACYALSERLKAGFRQTALTRWIATIGGWGAWLVVFLYYGSEWPLFYEFSIVLFIAAGVIFVTADGWTYSERMLSCPPVFFLSRLSLPMFLNQGWIRKILLYYKIGERFSYPVCIILFAGIVLAVSLISLPVTDFFCSRMKAAAAAVVSEQPADPI